MLIQTYSDKSFVVLGDTKPYRNELYALGGKFNANLIINGEKSGAWIFSLKNRERVEKFINSVDEPIYLVKMEIKRKCQNLLKHIMKDDNIQNLVDLNKELKQLMVNCSY